MKSRMMNKHTGWVGAAALLGALAIAVVFSLSASPAAASPLAQDNTPYPYPDDATPTVTNTAGPSPTAGATATATRAGTLPAPRPSGTPTQLVPLTGADLTGDGGSSMGVWIALWLLGLLMLGFGARARLRQH